MRSTTRGRATFAVAATAVAAAAALLTAACAKPAGPPGGAGTVVASPAATATSSSPGPIVTTSSAPTVDPALIFAADGIGPYQLGRDLAALDAQGLVTDLFNSPICPGVKIGESTGAYAGKLRLAFASNGKLWYIDTSSEDYQTPSGGKIGMTIVALKALYGSKGTVIPKSGPNIGGLLVPAGALGIVFLGDGAGKAYSMSAGPLEVVESFAKGGEGC
jgi:hypothetical protein